MGSHRIEWSLKVTGWLGIISNQVVVKKRSSFKSSFKTAVDKDYARRVHNSLQLTKTRLGEYIYTHI